MLSHEEWLHSPNTIELLRWLEKRREEQTLGCLEFSAEGETYMAASHAGRAQAFKDVLAKIRERKPNDESV